MIDIYVNDETSELKAVILGTAQQLGGEPTVEEAYDPKSIEHIKNGTYPTEEVVHKEIEAFAAVLKKHNVEVYRPEVLEDCNQIFSRDIGFVIEDKFVRPRILKDRKDEIIGIQYILDQIPEANKLEVPEGGRVEGGDVMPWHDHIFVGYSKEEDFKKYVVSRTNEEGVEFLKSSFPNKKVMAFELKKSDIDPKENALHLDCCFQPIGTDKAIVYKGGFKNVEDYEFLVNFFGKENIFEITKDEMYHMNSNVFSISEKVIVSEQNFTRLNTWLEEQGFTVERIPYSETAKMEGLLRCSTLPIKRVKK
ncbi:arginine deiminase-related protein [Fulvivirga maritima]|uniref:dimethylarginine dimethylaminohydrolase family protein n=1 Tax=Fulvivirga maritima TaxID=2904247 RepID=UPI001F205D0A|nr:arginine deiminase-related protein [Fulvivirga maritima]UII24468.1 arginine deiminase-related protein [Fulvivirga maritima]